MIIKNKQEIRNIKTALLEQLRHEQAFWSYSPESITVDSVDDDQLIALTMRYLDLPEIEQLFSIYSMRKIKNAWRRLLVREGEYLYTLNRFFSWYYFKVKNPDAYLRSLQTRYLNHLPEA